MTQQIRLWEITTDETLTEITSSEIPLEQKLEDWLESEISMLDSNMLVIGRQVPTGFGFIDLLCIDNSSDLVVVELKKGKTPREVTAQALDYASWVKDLSSQRITEIADEYLRDQGPLDDTFQNKFDHELPDTLNASHRSLIVAERLDDSTERIIQYLSELNVPINVLTVQQFQDAAGRRMLAQVYLVEPEVATERSRSQSKRTSYSVDRLHNIAHENGIGDLYGEIRMGVRGILNASAYRPDYVAYNAKRQEGGIRTVMSINTYPFTQEGGLGFNIHATRFETILGIEVDTLRECLPEGTQEASVPWRNRSRDEEQDAIGLEVLSERPKKWTTSSTCSGITIALGREGKPDKVSVHATTSSESIKTWRKEMKVTYEEQDDLFDISKDVCICDGSSIEEDPGVVLHFGTDGGRDIVAVTVMGASYWFKRGFDETSDTWLLGDTTSDPSLITKDGDFVGYWKPDEFHPDELPDPIGVEIKHASKHLASVRHQLEKSAQTAKQPQP